MALLEQHSGHIVRNRPSTELTTPASITPAILLYRFPVHLLSKSGSRAPTPEACIQKKKSYIYPSSSVSINVQLHHSSHRFCIVSLQYTTVKNHHMTFLFPLVFSATNATSRLNLKHSYPLPEILNLCNMSGLTSVQQNLVTFQS